MARVKTKGGERSTEQITELFRRCVEEVLNTGDFTTADELFAPDFVEHSAPPGFPGNLAGVEKAFNALHTAFPDLKYTIEDMLAEGDTVAGRITASGTMEGPFLGKPATGKHATWLEIPIARFKDGKLVEHWDVQDKLGRAQQLGLTPAPVQQGSR